MNIIDLRKKCRRRQERRSGDRRVNTFEFLSPEWIAVVSKRYAFWPKVDRRVANRRKDERRNVQRRQLQMQKHVKPEKRFSMNLLTNEEKDLFVDIFKDEM